MCFISKVWKAIVGILDYKIIKDIDIKGMFLNMQHKVNKNTIAWSS